MLTIRTPVAYKLHLPISCKLTSKLSRLYFGTGSGSISKCVGVRGSGDGATGLKLELEESEIGGHRRFEECPVAPSLREGSLPVSSVL